LSRGELPDRATGDMAIRKNSSRQATRRITAQKIRKLQRSGLISKRVDPSAKPSARVLSKLYKFRSVISGKEAAVRLSSAGKAKALRDKIGAGGAGRVVIVPRERGERFRVSAKDEIKSTRKAYGQIVEKTIGDKFTPPRQGEKIYYTIPRRKRGLGKLKRHTFASFDELLFYLEKYEIEFDDIEDFIEVERFSEGSRRQREFQREYSSAVRKLKRKRKSRRSRRR
jgi:hypothetical protein